MTIDISNYVIKKCSDTRHYNFKYNLYGVVEHLGTLSGGHYIAHINYGTIYNPIWYTASDKFVESTKNDSVKNSQGFLLFYERSK